MIGWEDNNGTVGPPALEAKHSLLFLYLPPVDDE
jgi:hypothetical protein